MDNIITITLNDNEHVHKIEFDSSPTLSELVASELIIKEVLAHNFATGSIYETKSRIYPRISDVEEVIRCTGDE